MALRDEIKRIYEKDGLDALWKWASGKPDRWKALKEWAEDQAKRYGDELARERNEVEAAEADLHRLADEINELRERVEDNRKRLKKAREEDDKPRVRDLLKRQEELDREVEKLKARIDHNEVQRKRALVDKHNAKQARKAWLERKVIYREKWEKAKKAHRDQGGGPGKWEDWMGAGLDDNVTDEVKEFAAWGVLEYDLTITSMRRTYVPPGGSTTSHHLRTPGHAADLAGERMTAFQQAAFSRYKGDANCLELFGPDNSDNLKNGGVIYLGEGTDLENLHDSHVHGAFA